MKTKGGLKELFKYLRSLFHFVVVNKDPLL